VPPAGSNRLVIGLVVAAVLLGSGTLAIFLLTR
jgi:hypothetical protein